uniref:Uncharacterized protein n=1 Tax=Arundo donax TaxID=35708 RepID=A0A0A9BAA6_ARUDO
MIPGTAGALKLTPLKNSINCHFKASIHPSQSFGSGNQNAATRLRSSHGS